MSSSVAVYMYDKVFTVKKNEGCFNYSVGLTQFHNR